MLTAMDVSQTRAKINTVTSPTPISLLYAGGYLAIAFLRNRENTEDLYYCLEPQWVYDDDVRKPLYDSIRRTGQGVGFPGNWANEEIAVFVPQRNK